MAETLKLIVPADDPHLLREVTEKLQEHIASITVSDQDAVPKGGVYDELQDRIQKPKAGKPELFAMQETVWVFQIMSSAALTMGFLLNVFDRIQNARKEDEEGVLVETKDQKLIPLEEAEDEINAAKRE